MTKLKLKLYQVDAFAEKVFEGNPAAVCPLDEWLDDAILQRIAEENNLSETAFFVANDRGFDIRWFTPVEEVDLCGHATLAAAHVLFKHMACTGNEILFSSRSGELRVKQVESGICMDFPASILNVVPAPPALIEGLGIKPAEVLAAFDYIVVLHNEKEVKDIKPDFSKWMDIDLRGVVVTALGEETDFVSRCFFPKLRVNEDPVTGSAHCELAPYWGKKLHLQRLVGKQLSNRTGLVQCELVGDRVQLTGQAVDYLLGHIIIER